MVRYAARRGVRAVGITLSAEQATWAQKAIADEGLSDLAEVRHGDYREISETEFDAVSSIGLTEHIGVANYPAYFRFLRSKVRIGGLLLNHCITRPGQQAGIEDRRVHRPLRVPGRRADRLRAGSSPRRRTPDWRCCTRRTCDRTTRAPCATGAPTSSTHWDEAVAEVGLGTARVWGLYMAGSRLGFERNVVQLHQVLAVKTDGRGGGGDLPLRPWWRP